MTETGKGMIFVQGYNDKVKSFFVHNSPTLRQTSGEIIVSCASLLDFHIFLLDITQAYLQSENKLTRPV